MKRLIWTMIAVMLIGILAWGAADAANSGTCGDNLTWSLDGGVLSISGYGSMNNYNYYSMPWYNDVGLINQIEISHGVTNIGNYAFYNCYNVSEISIPNSVTNIGNYAFANSGSLSSVSIPNTVTRIGDYAFGSCTNLSYVTIPGSVKYIGGNAFNCCENLYSITILDGVNSIGNYAFYGCENLTDINLPDSITSIGYGAFQYCTSLSSIIIPEPVTRIESYVFSGCENLTDISIPYGVTYIGSYAFSSCRSLTALTIPNGVTQIESYAFQYCNNLSSITLPDALKQISNSAFSNFTGLAYITIPNGVTAIGENAFYNCTNLINVSIPDSVESIGQYAFQNCKKLADIRIPNSVTSIGMYAFQSCSSLTSVVIPDDLNTIYAYTFSGCSRLSSVSIPVKTKYIYNAAFENCTNLTDVYYGGSADQWAGISINNCPALTNASLHYNMGSCGDNLRWSLSNDGTLSISGSGRMRNYASYDGAPWYSKKSSIVSIEISDQVTGIGDFAFSGCSNVTDLIIPNSVADIGKMAFRSCSGLVSITMPDDISLGNGAFANCTGLQDENGFLIIQDILFGSFQASDEGTVPDGVHRIDYGAFQVSFSQLSLPDTITHIDNSAFLWGGSSFIFCNPGTTTEAELRRIGVYYRIPGQKYSLRYLHTDGIQTGIEIGRIDSDVTSFTIPDGVTNIANQAFYNHQQLTSVVIPEGMVSIGEAAFLACSNLTSITIPASVTYVGPEAFQKCTNLTSFHVSEGNLSFTTVDNVLYTKDMTALLACPVDRISMTVPDSVTRIRSYAFRGCGGLTDIQLPDGLTEIGAYAFYECSQLRSIEIPDGVTTINMDTFCDCKNLSYICIPTSITSIKSDAFYKSNVERVYYAGTEEEWNQITGITALQKATKHFSVTGPYSIESGECGDGLTWSLMDYGELTISGTGEMTSHPWTMSNVKNVIINQGVTNICDEAFYNCSTLLSIAVPDSVTSIGDSAFYNCSALSGITIPDGTATIGSNAFQNCGATRYASANTQGAIALSKAGYSFTAPDSVFYMIFSFEGEEITDTIITAIRNKSITSFEFPDYITGIGASAFSNCTALTSLTIPESVTTIGSSAFSGCNKLNSITFPNGITSIGSSAFYNCSALYYATINTPTALTLSRLGYSFVPIGEEIKVIHTYSNDQITGTSLTGIANKSISTAVVPNYITRINTSAFSGCSNLSVIDMHSRIPILIATSFDGCAQSVSIILPNETVNLSGGSYGVCGDHAIYSLKDGALHVYGSGAMWDYSQEKYVIRDYYSNYSHHYEYGYRATTPWKSDIVNSVIIHQGITSIGLRAFTDKALTSVSIPSSVNTIGEYAFSGCSRLESLEIPSSVNTIGEYAFSGCSRLESLTIPSSVSAINAAAFGSCYGLADVYFEGDAPSFGSSAFSGVTCNVHYTPNSSWAGKVQNYGGNLTWIKPGASSGTDTVWVLDDLNVLRLRGGGIVNQATWNEYANGITTLVVAADLGGIDSGVLSTLPNLQSIIFEGDLPENLSANAFSGIFANAYYSHSNPAWTDEILLGYGGTLNWQRYCTHSGASIDPFEAVHYDETAPADCVTDGYVEHWKCSNCSLAFTDEAMTQRMADEALYIPAPGHTLILIEGTPASCIETGLSDGIFCEVCGEVLQEQEEIPLAEHTDSITIEEIPATCITVGYTAEHRCSVCGELLAEVEEIPFGDHTDSISVEAIEPTCTAIGYTAEHRCAVCDILLEEIQEVPMVPHTDSISVEAVEPTCSAVGHTEEHRCSVCDELLIPMEEIARLPHTDSITIEYLAPTCTAAGHTEEHTCSVCGEVTAASEVIAATGHTYNDPTTVWSEDGHNCTFTFECAHEDDTRVIEVGATASVDTDPACLEMGTSLYTATTEINEKTYSATTTRVDIPATGHIPAEDPAVAPTDRETGLTVGSHCSACGIILDPQEVIPALWSYSEDGFTATAYNGTETELTIPEGVTALSNTLFKNNTSVTSVHVPAEVTTLGTQTFFGATGMTDIWLPENLDGIGMQTFYNTTAVLHTSADGLTAKGISLRSRNFTDGDYTLRYKITSITSNPTATYLISWQGDKTELILPDAFGGAPLTQIQSGAFTGKTQLQRIVIPDSVTTIAADAFNGCSDDLIICSSMTAYAKTWAENNGITWKHYPHTEVIDEGTAPTCTEPGMTEGKHCADCNEIMIAQEEIPATGHRMTEFPAAEATCTEVGHSAYWACEYCGEFFSDADGETMIAENSWVIPATGHQLSAMAAKEPTCTEEGNTACWMCDLCGKHFSDADGETEMEENSWNISALGHEWSEPMYEWSDDHSHVTATRTCQRGDHPETETVQTERVLITAPTETTAGSFQASTKAFENTAFAIQTKTDLPIPALGEMNVMTLPGYLTTIETEAFEGVAAEAIIVPATCTTIEAKAFVNCQNLKYVKIPTGVRIPEDAFDGCPVVVIDQR